MSESVPHGGSDLTSSLPSPWWVDAFGDPCRECGFDWSLPHARAVGWVSKCPTRFAAAIADTDGAQRHPDLAWSAKAYVFHVGDNLRIWAERLVAYSTGATGEVPGYDENLLAVARRYEDAPLQAALWSLQQQVTSWSAAVSMARGRHIVLHHGERGELTVDEVALGNCHDAFHHLWDVRRCVAAGVAGGRAEG